MSEKPESLHGLSCPNCGGMVPVPQGYRIVQCPYCQLRSFVRGERGLRRYQTPCRVDRQAAIAALRRFLSSHFAIARDAMRQAQISEAFLVFLPFWTIWGRVAAWAFGQKKVGSGDHTHYEPREVRIVQEMTWNGAACDVGEFGVASLPIADQELQPFNPDALHNEGLVFEPVGSVSDAHAAADKKFRVQVTRKAGLDRLAQLFSRTLRSRLALVYHPLWILRYLYRGRAFQVVVDGSTGKVLYGKAPGNTLYRAAVLVGGMALGAILAIDIPSLILFSSSNSSHDSGGSLGFAFAVLIAGLVIMLTAYRAFRRGEQYEYQSSPPEKISLMENPMEMLTNVKDVEEWIHRLT
jgi:DNA-directed RNA polymerase subunit RPC12/RpoP